MSTEPGYFRDRNKKLESMVDGRANERQVGGSHYRATNSTMQHWDLMAVNNAGYFVGQVTKYVARWKNKSGIQDLEKSEHYLQKLIELHHEGVMDLPSTREAILLTAFHHIQHLGLCEFFVFRTMLTYTTIGELQQALEEIAKLKSIAAAGRDDATKRIPL